MITKEVKKLKLQPINHSPKETNTSLNQESIIEDSIMQEKPEEEDSNNNNNNNNTEG